MCTQFLWSTMVRPVLSGTGPVKPLYGFGHHAAAQFQGLGNLCHLYVDQQFIFSDPQRVQHSDGRVRIWRKEHESMDPSCLVSTVQAGGGGVMVWGIFSWHTLGPLVPIEHRLNATAYLSIVADHVHPFMTTVYPSSDGYFQQDNAPCHKS